MSRNARSYENCEIFVRQVEIWFEEGPQRRILPNLRKSQKWFYLAGKWNYYDGIMLDAPTILDSSRHSVSWNEARKKRLNGLV